MMTTPVMPLEYQLAIQNFRLIDDDFMNAVFIDKQCLELTLSIIFDDDISVLNYQGQYLLKNLHGRDAQIDAFIKTKQGHYINVEVQRKDDGAHPKRARYHNSLIDATVTNPSEQWHKIPAVFVIFITENDVLKCGLPIYHINRTIEETGARFNDETVIIYVNASIQDETKLGRLMHDFMCKDYREIHYDILRERIRHFKETEGGRQEMCEIMDNIRNMGKAEGLAEGLLEGKAYGKAEGLLEGKTEGLLEGKAELIKRLMEKQKMTFEEVVKMLDISVSEQMKFKELIVL